MQQAEKQKLIIRVGGTDYSFAKPYYLYVGDDFKNPIKPVVKGSVLVWHIEGKQITYNKLKNNLKLK